MAATTAIARRRRGTRDIRQVRSERLALLWAGLVAPFIGAMWLIHRTWLRVFPFYWALGAVAASALAGWLGLQWTLVALAGLAVTAAAAAWRGRLAVRIYRGAVFAVFAAFAAVTVAVGGIAAHPTMAVFGPTLAAAVLGWPWWHHLRSRAVDTAPQAPVLQPDEILTAYWRDRWATEVVAQDVCKGTRLVAASSPRPGVIEAVIRITSGRTQAIMRQGNDVEVQLDLAEGAVGWRSTGRAAKVQIVIVEKSQIDRGVQWRGPTYANGRCQLTTFTDGTPGYWTFSRPKFGMLNGLVVGSVGAGKSSALSVLIENLLDAGWMVPVGDPQNGQSLPDWRHAASEYHEGVDATELLLRRLHAEVMRRSRLLSDVGVSVYDEDDPRVQALGLKPMMAVVDEVHLVLDPNKKKLVILVEELTSISRKTGVGVILATQLPQMKSLGGSIRIRDALVAGNAFIMRLSNRGSGTTVLPDDFIGDPFTIPAELDGRMTAGMGYLRNTNQVGMLSRVPNQDATAAASAAPRVPMQWQVPQPKTDTAKSSAATSDSNDANATGGGAADRLRAVFGIRSKTSTTVIEERQPASTPEWVIACLRKAPASAQALLDRPDCPVNQAQLYVVLSRLTDTGRIAAPQRRGGNYTLN